MRWPPEHPLRTDPELAPWRPGADAICPEGEVGAVLRYVPARRVTTFVRTAAGPCVLKVFARPRARGNHRRLTWLAESPVADLVPRSHAVDPSGHVALVAYVDGVVYDQLGDDVYVERARDLGVAVRRLHDSGATSDRVWLVADELKQLLRRRTARTHRDVMRLVTRAQRLVAEPLVTAHRDLHPRQVVLRPDGTLGFIDLDDAAMAPRALDVGNVVAHLRTDHIQRGRSAAATEGAIRRFLAGYGRVDGDLRTWEQLALARLAGLAETRHGRVDHAEAILDLLHEREGALR